MLEFSALVAFIYFIFEDFHFGIGASECPISFKVLMCFQKMKPSTARLRQEKPTLFLLKCHTHTHLIAGEKKKVIRDIMQISDVGSCEMYKDYTIAGTVTSHRDSSSNKNCHI